MPYGNFCHTEFATHRLQSEQFVEEYEDDGDGGKIAYDEAVDPIIWRA